MPTEPVRGLKAHGPRPAKTNWRPIFFLILGSRMTVARELAEFLTRLCPADLPPQAVDHAAMLIASTLASAALGSGIASSVMIRDLARDRGGIAEASLWFDAGPKLPVFEAA